jgi:hypothetical protein
LVCSGAVGAIAGCREEYKNGGKRKVRKLDRKDKRGRENGEIE